MATRGGGPACAVLLASHQVSGHWRKLADRPFQPDRLASRILGMGDVLSLIERAQDSISTGAEALEKKLQRENSA